MRDRIFGVFLIVVGWRHALSARALFFDEGEIDRALHRRRRADDKRPVNLARILVLELLAERGSGASGAREHNDAARVAVEAVNKLGALGGIECQRVEHTVEMAAGARAAQPGEAGGLVELGRDW